MLRFQGLASFGPSKGRIRCVAGGVGVVGTGKVSGSEEEPMSRLKRGDRAPAFRLEDQEGRVVKRSDFKGRKLLVYFYPKADTPG